MKINKVLFIFCCLVGFVCVGNAQIWRGVAKAPKAAGSAFKTSAAVRAAQKAHLAKWSYRPLAEGDVQIGRALLQDKLPEIGTTAAYVRKAKWGEMLMPKLSPKLSEKLIARHVFEAAFPGYMTDFMRDFRIFEEESKLSWTGELKKILDTYGPEARFAGGFVPSFANAVGFTPVPSRWTKNAKHALDDAWLDAAQQRAGFFVVAVESPLINGGKDVLLLDTKGKRFISLAQSSQALQPQLAYAPKPVGDVAIGQSLLTNQVENIFYPGYIPRFWRSYEAREREFGVDEWTKVLQTYGKDAYFYVDFKSSFKEVVSYRPEDALYWAGETEGTIGYHLLLVVEDSAQKVGFLVVYLKRNNPAVATSVEEDVLILDLENKRFISLNESLKLAEHK